MDVVLLNTNVVSFTALQHRMPLVTHNPADFEAIEELELITTVT